MGPVGANASSPPEPLEEQTSKSYYFIGNEPARWLTNLTNHAKVRYRDVYPGVDLIYYGNQRQPEYDFVVSPGADPSSIILDFEGAAKPALDRSGDLVMHTSGGELRWHKPVAYQEVKGSQQLVGCSYVRRRGRLAFRLGAYDKTRPLVIDPVLAYSTYLGGGNEDGGSAITVDGIGNAYVTGHTFSTDFPTRNPYQANNRGGSNAFVAKFDAAGKLVYSTYLGGMPYFTPDNGPTQGDFGTGIAVPMLQALLEDRFKLKVHRETRDIPFYELTVAPGGPKVQPFQGSCVPWDYDHPNPGPEQCAQTEPTRDGAEMKGWAMADLCYFLLVTLDRPVIDKTGITGRFNIDLELSPEAAEDLKHGARGAPARTDLATPTTDSLLISAITTWVNKIGLDLEPATGPAEFIVIDRAERPSEQ